MSAAQDAHPTTAQTLGVIDIGSNSGRVLVARVSSAAHLDVVADARSPLRLVRDVAKRGALSAETMDRTLRILRGFATVARTAGAERTCAVATAAVREAANGDEFITRARADLGLDVTIADGDQEARYGFLGAVHGLPIEHGIVLDVGGGSLQLTHFRDRRIVRAWSLKLGALRVSDRFLKSDPPTRGEIRELKSYVYAALEVVGVGSLQADERLVATGGTVRNLAKVDRRMIGDYPISRLHGYVVDRRRLDDVGATLIGARLDDRAHIPGLNGDRADSIVGGALVVQSVMDRLLASQLTVAGYGLREGVALSNVTDQVASIQDVRRAAIRSLGQRFGTWDEPRAERRAALADELLATMAHNLADETRIAAAVCARLLEIGASIDYYRRHTHSARIVADANLDGFSHRTLALAAAALHSVGESEASVRAFGPVLTQADTAHVERIAAAVALADALVRYRNPDSDDSWPRRHNGTVALAAPLAELWPLETPRRRAERAFGLDITFAAGDAPYAS